MWEECYATCNRKKFDLCASSSYGECPHLLALTFPESSDSSDTSRHEPNNASSLKRHEELPKMKARQPNPYTHRQKYIYIYTLHTNIDFKKNQSNEHQKNGPGREVLGIKKISCCWLDGSISHSLEHKTPPKGHRSRWTLWTVCIFLS